MLYISIYLLNELLYLYSKNAILNVSNIHKILLFFYIFVCYIIHIIKLIILNYKIKNLNFTILLLNNF